MVVATLTLSGGIVVAQDSPAATSMPAVASNVPVPELSVGMAQILKLKQADIGDATVVAYIKKSVMSYDLNADQIIYLRRQGVSDAVLTAMLQQPKARVASVPTTPALAPAASPADTGQASTATVAPTVTYVQTVPAMTYYCYQPYYYPSYAWYPPVSLSIGWSSGWYGGWHGGGYYGGRYGGWHGSSSGGGGHGGGGHNGGGWHH